MAGPTTIFQTRTVGGTSRRFGFSGELPSPKVLKGLQDRCAVMLGGIPADRVELCFPLGDGTVSRVVNDYAQFVEACAAAVRGSTKDGKGRQVRQDSPSAWH